MKRLFGLALGLLSVRLAAQPVVQGHTPPGMEMGAPAGSYALKDFEHINLFNGSLNVNIPLHRVEGRGGVGYTISLTIDQRWSVRGVGGVMTQGLQHPWYNERSYDDLEPGYSPGVMVGRKASKGRRCNETTYTQTSLTRLSFIGADGTQYEFRDASLLYAGKPVSIVCSPTPPDRGRIFVTKDGSFATFRSDAPISDIANTSASNGEEGYVSSTFRPTGDLVLKDGLRYRIEDGLVVWMKDRNGNLLTFAYENVPFPQQPRITSVRDSSNRLVRFEYGDRRDTIWFLGYEGRDRAIEVNRYRMSRVLSPGQVIKTYGQLFPALGGGTPIAAFDPYVVGDIFLPNNRSYQFQYNSYGEVATVQLPTAGLIFYDYDGGLRYPSGSPAASGAFTYLGPTGLTGIAIYRRLYERVVGQGPVHQSVTRFSKPEGLDGSNDGYVEVEEITEDPQSGGGVLQTTLRRTRHYFHGGARDSFGQEPYVYSPWRTGREYRTEVFEGDGRLLRRTEMTWEQGESSPPWFTGSADLAPPMNPRLKEQTTALARTGGGLRTSKTSYSYDAYNNPTETREYDYANGIPLEANLLRKTERTYLTAQNGLHYDTDFSIHIKDLVKTERVVGKNGEEAAFTTYHYDEYGSSPDTVLVDRTYVTQHDTSYDTSWTARGNVTSIDRKVDALGATISVQNQYDILGNIVKTIGARGQKTEIDFADSFGSVDGGLDNPATPPELVTLLGVTLKTFAYPTSVKNPLNQVSRTMYDYHLGKTIRMRDPNGVESIWRYLDVLDRLNRHARGLGVGTANTNTQIYYNDYTREITVAQDHTNFNDGWIKTIYEHDTFGRLTFTSKLEYFEPTDPRIITQQFVDSLERPTWVSNPYRSDEPPPGGHIAWNRTFHDALDRPVSHITPDTAEVVTVYDGDEVLVIDPAGKKRRTRTDALGRITWVTEDPGGLNYTTNYEYDALGNLTKVYQGLQTRSFDYDFLSRLTRATNPESGIENYTYDSDGNLLTREDARHVVTTNTYDLLGRIKTKSYSDGTPGVTYTYDVQPEPAGGSFPVGRLTSVSSGTGSNLTKTAYTYDPIGQVTKSVQTIGDRSFTFGYAYNRAGLRTEIQYPSGRRVATDYDLLGQPYQMNEAASNSYYVLWSEYHPHGAPKTLALGNGKYEGHGFTKRLQPAFIGLGHMPGKTNNLTLSYRYDPNNGDADAPTPNNNGNIAFYRAQIGTFQPAWVVKYTYDGVNRLSSAQETLPDGETETWHQNYAYDRFGNRAVLDGSYRPSPQTPQGIGAYNVAKNQLWTAQYDAAGNMTVDPAGRIYTYDAENRQMTFRDAAGLTRYVYDGQGRRVKVSTPAQTTLCVYDANGKLATEYGSTTGTAAAGLTYLTLDHLGTPRLMTDATGQLVARHDYLPFGEEIPASFGIRPDIAGGYGQVDGIKQRFTGKERDGESGNDYFQARYYSSAVGLFLSPDPDSAGARQGEPQSWNAYAYALSNPTKYLDEDGESATLVGAAFGAVIGGGVAWYRGDSVWKGAVSGAVAGALAGAVIDTGGAALGVYGAAAAGGALGGVGGGVVARALDGEATTVEQAATDAVVGAAGGVIGAAAGKAVTYGAQRLMGPAPQFETLRLGQFADDSIPATGPKVTPAQRAALAGDRCHTCGTTSGKTIGDHQPSTKLVVRGSEQTLTRHCPSCSGRQGSQVRQQNKIWRGQQARGTQAGAAAGAAARPIRPPSGEER